MLDSQTGGLPISYEHGEAEKVPITDKLIYESDIGAFNSKIGFITNASSTLHSLKYDFEEGSPGRIEIERRLMIFRLYQGESIDAGKKGGESRQIPPFWTRYDKTKSSLENSITVDRRPYFTRYLYPSYNKRYIAERDAYNKYCWSHYGRSFQSVLDCEERNTAEEKTVANYYKYSFFIFASSPMNNLSKYMESFFIHLSQSKKKANREFDYSELFSKRTFKPRPNAIKKMGELYIKYNSAKKALRLAPQEIKKDIWHIIDETISDSLEISSNSEELGNLAVAMIIENHRTSSFAWTVFGNYIVENLGKRYGRQIDVLIRDDYGDVDFLFDTFRRKRIMV